MDANETFDVKQTGDPPSGEVLLVGQTHLGLAGMTAADYLVRQLEAREIGHVAPSELPAIAPFEEGIPRHHSRLYGLAEPGMQVLVGELFIPVSAARPFVDALLEWSDEQGIDEIAILHGVPFPHGPDEHDVFQVATEAYRERRLSGQQFQPLKGGFLDGVAGELLTRSLDDTAPETGVFITPTHPPGPDVDAALRLLGTIETLYGVEVDESELRELGEQFKEYYEQLVERMTAAEGDQALGSHDYPVDRMYM